MAERTEFFLKMLPVVYECYVRLKAKLFINYAHARTLSGLLIFLVMAPIDLGFGR